MKKSIFAVILFAVALAVSALSAQAAEVGRPYVGATVGQSSYDISTSDWDDGSLTSSSVDKTGNAWKVFGGFRFHQNAAAEVYYTDLGKTTFDGVSNGSGSVWPAGNVSGDLKAHAFGASLIGLAPLSGGLTPFAKIGFADYSADLTLHAGGASVAASDSGTKLMYGAGVTYDVGKVGLRAEFERFTKIADINVNVLSIGAQIGF